MNLHQQNQYTISIIGLGKLGTALGNQLIGCTVKGWDVVDTDNSIQTDTLYEAICDADTIFIVVPSEFFVETIMSIIRAYSDHGRWIEATRVNMVSFTKGICNNKLPIDIMKKNLPFNPLGVVSGPMLSNELDSVTHAMLGTYNMNIYNASSIITRMEHLRLHKTDNATGVTLCGIMKNVYAVGMGMLCADNITDNGKSCYANMALNEMAYVVGNDCILSYAGVGDFLTTCYSTKSRNFTYGWKTQKGEDTDNIMAEGVKNVHELLNYSSVDLPIIRAVKTSLQVENAQPLRSVLTGRNR